MIYPEKFAVLDMLEFHPNNLWIYMHLDDIIRKIRPHYTFEELLTEVFYAMRPALIDSIFQTTPLYERLKQHPGSVDGGKHIIVPLRYR